ncbi:SEPTIN3 [Scenedesmus sp. PABB004]|nr:SEPTIN3 [Scenedesmus sp. PABB004]
MYGSAFSSASRNGRGEPILGEGSNPMQSLDLGNKRASVADSHADGFDGYANGDGGARRADRLNSFNSTMSGRLYDSRVNQQALLGPRRPRPHKIWTKKFIKVLVVGDSGLGKTTLVKTLLSTPGERLQVHDGTYTPADQFVKDPDSLCSTVTWKDEEDRVIWVYRIQDTPGYGDDLDIMNHITMITGHLNDCNDKWLAMESARDRAQDLSEVEDPRVDVCLFCVPPHRLRPIDIRYMHELGKAVPIIPVITKADTMTIREAQNYKQEVFSRLQVTRRARARARARGGDAAAAPRRRGAADAARRAAQNPCVAGVRGKINTFRFDKETLERAGMGDAAGSATPPFLVIASNDINEEMNQMDVPVFWPERRYPWGTAQAFNPDHSDLLHLRALLLKEALEDICKDKRNRYETWRRHRLAGPRFGTRLKRFAISTVLPVAAAVYVAQRGVDVQQVRDRLSTLKAKLRRGGRPAAAAPAAVTAAPEPAPLPEPEPEPEPAPAAPPAKKGWWLFWGSGIACASVACLIFSLSGLQVKLTGDRVPVLQLCVVRSGVSFATSIAVGSAARVAPLFGRRQQMPLLLARGLLGSVAMAASYVALLALPLGDAVTIAQLRPPATALVAWALLGEPLGARGLLGCAVSLAGVVVLAHPPFLFGGHGQWRVAGNQRLAGTLSGVASTLAGSGAALCVRRIGKREAALTVALWFHTATVVLMAPLLAAGWPQPATAMAPRDCVLLAGIACSSFCAQLLMTRAVQLVAAARAAAVGFTGVLWSHALGALVFGEHATPGTLAGGALLFAGVLLVVGPGTSPPPPPVQACSGGPGGPTTAGAASAAGRAGDDEQRALLSCPPRLHAVVEVHAEADAASSDGAAACAGGLVSDAPQREEPGAAPLVPSGEPQRLTPRPPWLQRLLGQTGGGSGADARGGPLVAAGDDDAAWAAEPSLPLLRGGGSFGSWAGAWPSWSSPGAAAPSDDGTGAPAAAVQLPQAAQRPGAG